MKRRKFGHISHAIIDKEVQFDSIQLFDSMVKKSNFGDIAEGVAKVLEQNEKVQRIDSKHLKWKVTGRGNTQWTLGLEKLSDQELTVRFQRIE